MGLLSSLFNFKRSDPMADYRRGQVDKELDRKAERVNEVTGRAYEVARRLDAQLAVQQHRNPTYD
jgi:hypothetical protein